MNEINGGANSRRVLVREILGRRGVVDDFVAYVDLTAFARNCWSFRSVLVDATAVEQARRDYVAEAHWGPMPRSAKYDVRYGDGSSVPYADLARAAEAAGIRILRKPFRPDRFASFVFRDGPVPNIRRGRGYSNWLRFMRTTQERRENAGLVVDEDARAHHVVPRGERLALPNAWDDVGRGKSERSWKRHRARQWKSA